MSDHPSPSGDVHWAVLVPLKPPSTAKSRLALPPDQRAQLVMAMAADVVEAASRCPDVALVVVVAEDADGLEPLQQLGAAVVVDPEHESLNASLRHAAAVVAARDSSYGIASLVADVAGVRTEQLGRALAASVTSGTAFVPDAAGRGSTLVASTRWAAFLPEYGRHSRRRHVDAGFTELLLPDAEGLRLDVDTLADLQPLRALGAGPRTTGVLGSLSLPLQ